MVLFIEKQPCCRDEHFHEVRDFPQDPNGTQCRLNTRTPDKIMHPNCTITRINQTEKIHKKYTVIRSKYLSQGSHSLLTKNPGLLTFQDPREKFSRTISEPANV